MLYVINKSFGFVVEISQILSLKNKLVKLTISVTWTILLSFPLTFTLGIMQANFHSENLL